MKKRDLATKNQLSIFNLLPKESPINRGVLFNQLPHIMMIYSGVIESPSGLFLKLSALASIEITSDSQIIRKLNNDSLEKEDIDKFFDHLGVRELLHNDSDEQYIGGWLLLDSLIRGVQASNKIPEIDEYLVFVRAVCNIDKELIKESLCAAKKNQTALTVVEYAKPWLLFSDSYITAPTLNKAVEYYIATILHWTALFEYFIILDWPELIEKTSEKAPPFSFQKYIPKIKKGKIAYSTNIFLENLKQQYGKTTDSSKATWNGLYKNIAENGQNNSSYDAIEKQFKRWKRGTRMTVRSFDKLKSYISSLIYKQGLPDEKEQSQMFFRINSITIFIQIFDSLQRDLIKEGLPHNFIVEQFGRYPLYVDMVSRRYHSYCKKGVINP